jgi:hypothetical protein
LQKTLSNEVTYIYTYSTLCASGDPEMGQLQRSPKRCRRELVEDRSIQGRRELIQDRCQPPLLARARPRPEHPKPLRAHPRPTPATAAGPSSPEHPRPPRAHPRLLPSRALPAASRPVLIQDRRPTAADLRSSKTIAAGPSSLFFGRPLKMDV